MVTRSHDRTIGRYARPLECWRASYSCLFQRYFNSWSSTTRSTFIGSLQDCTGIYLPHFLERPKHWIFEKEWKVVRWLAIIGFSGKTLLISEKNALDIFFLFSYLCCLELPHSYELLTNVQFTHTENSISLSYPAMPPQYFGASWRWYDGFDEL